MTLELLGSGPPKTPTPNKELEARRKYLEQAKVWLANDDGLASLKNDVIQTLMVNLQIERDAGMDTTQNPRDSRQSRKQYEETAKLLMEVLETR